MIFYVYTNVKKKNKNGGDTVKFKDANSGMTVKGKVPKYSYTYTYLGVVKGNTPKLARKRAKDKWPDAPFLDILFKDAVVDKTTGAMTGPKWTKPKKVKKSK